MSEEQINTPPVMDDTKTRKTIKLRPLHPVTPQVSVAPAAEPAVNAGDDTRTRKTIKLKPLTAPAAPTFKMPAAAASDEIAQPIFQDTKTQKAIQLSKAAPTVAPATIAIDDDRTVKMKRPVPAAPAVSTPDRTVKISRPAPAAPVIPAVKAEEQTVKIARPAPVAPAVKIPTPALKPAENTASKAAPQVISLSAPAKKATVTGGESAKDRKVFAAVAIATVIFLAIAGTISVVHYLSLDHGINIENNIPGLPVAK